MIMTGKGDLGKGIIFRKSIQCKHCVDIIVSKHRHDWKQCKCGACFVDGGHDYLRRGYKTKMEDDFIELSEYEDVPAGEEKDR